jgi:D-alanyl-D-alanine carboxypeptidase (penicillin-binding protein 5/6)
LKLLSTLLLAALALTGHGQGGLGQYLQHAAAGDSSPLSEVSPPALNPAPVPVANQPLAPNVGAASAFAVDLDSGAVLFAKNANQERPIASITKIATALVILRRHDPNETVTIPKLPTYGPDDEVIGLTPGEKFKINDLLTAMLVQSANDAGDALAIIDAGNKDAFAARMNAVTSDWGIEGAHFSNPTGLQDKGNEVSAEALEKIGALSIRSQIISNLVATPVAQISNQSGKIYNLHTTDQLLSNGAFQGIKTGYTPAAGECFLGLTKINGHPVITVILGSTNRFGDTQILVDWIKQNYQWI